MLPVVVRKKVKNDLAIRVLQSSDALSSELVRRGLMTESELSALRAGIDRTRLEALLKMQPLKGSLLAAELANADRQLAARAVLRRLLSPYELQQLHTMLKYQPRGKRRGKLDELIRIVERATGKVS